MKIIFATNNSHKIEEAGGILGDKFKLETPAGLGITDDIPEDCDTLQGNALQKAKYIFESTGQPCFADDTGLEVDCLDGAPGVRSARYAGDGHDFEANIDLLIDNMEGVKNRKARFRTVVAFVDGKLEKCFDGKIEGVITETRQGKGGFGYDSVFIPDGYDTTFAEMSPSLKNSISHRGIAMIKFAEFIKRLLREMKSYKAKGIVLHTIKYGEKSLIVYMLTDAKGRQTYIVGNGKGNKKAFLQPMFPLEFTGLESSRMELHRMKDIVQSPGLRNVPFDIRKSTISLFVAETIYRIIREVEEESPLFDFILQSVYELDNLTDGISNFHLWFLANLIQYMGIAPGNMYESGAFLDIREGTYTHIRPGHNECFSRETTALLSQLNTCVASGLGAVKINRETRNEFLNSLLRYYSYHLDMFPEIKSLKILRDVF